MVASSEVHLPVIVPAGGESLHGDLAVPASALGIVLFAHGSGSSRRSPRNRYVAEHLRDSGLATLLLDLLTEEEEAEDFETGHLRFDVPFLASRLLAAMRWVLERRDMAKQPLGLFGASTGAAAALVAAAQAPEVVRAVVSRGGRPDLAGEALAHLLVPTLLIVGGADTQVIALNRSAFAQIPAAEKDLEIVPGATHLFEEPGAIEEVARLTLAWFERHLAVQA